MCIAVGGEEKNKKKEEKEIKGKGITTVFQPPLLCHTLPLFI